MIVYSFKRCRKPILATVYCALCVVILMSAYLFLASEREEEHHVNKGVRRPAQSPEEIRCELKSRATLRTVDGSEEPFSHLGWSRLVPSTPLKQIPGRYENQCHFKTCAVVSSAGAMLHSGLGEEIDSHDAVIRFNHAPTEGYENDVGSRTTIRLVNEQIPHTTRFQFKTSALYRDVTLVAWEKAPHDLNLTKWYSRGKLFAPYAERRRLDPGQPFYALHPVYLDQLWQVIQGNTLEDIKPNPPSSGFMGIALMMELCHEVHVYEYIPSERQTALCHYFEKYENIACSRGGSWNWHPLEFEKRLIRRINTGSEDDLRRGRVTLLGFSAVNCDIRGGSDVEDEGATEVPK